MNRLVIIGNGFDLAHGLKSRYEDFLVDYFKSAIKNSQDVVEGFEDELLIIKSKERFTYQGGIPVEDTFNSLEELLTHDHIELPLNSFTVTFTGDDTYATNKPISIKIKSEFFKILLVDQNWTDIEKLYFDFLLLQHNDKSKNFNIKQLNIEFETLKVALKKYLTKQDETVVVDRNKSSQPHFVIDKCCEGVYVRKEILDPIPNIKAESIKNIVFLNFNYTKVLRKYLDINNVQDVLFQREIAIHGNVDTDIIFGYGDDTHKEYEKLENSNDDDFLWHMKSFSYSTSPNYNNLMGFLEDDDFEVYVIGHSLGLSDRVLLKAIFEHQFCKSIRLFHRGSKESFMKKHIALSRHFSDKDKMRRKIIDYDVNDILN